jgi:hypothetical protein
MTNCSPGWGKLSMSYAENKRAGLGADAADEIDRLAARE